MSIRENISTLRRSIPDSATIVAATKTRSVTEILEAVHAGLTIIGENYVQEAARKLTDLKGMIHMHCIGHLQTNKIKEAVRIFDMIQTVDSEKCALEIDKWCKAAGKTMHILIEVNSGKEKNKDGVMPEEVVPLIKKVSSLKNVRIKGLMTMAPYFDDPQKCRPYFKLVHTLFGSIKGLKIPHIEMEILSMGMSHSYKVAIEEGATMIRIGEKIFGGNDLLLDNADHYNHQ
ncbi:MAG TPA: YggS family pyridoxal phosphate-dependent enzyme [Candidatus Nanoarchaeia archaeon]|nr:YggS family pyridoxal phosphate-dependent enzyme [Candidatus Nanoarchaeia archaeon]